jgi:hypothetical protein
MQIGHLSASPNSVTTQRSPTTQMSPSTTPAPRSTQPSRPSKISKTRPIRYLVDGGLSDVINAAVASVTKATGSLNFALSQVANFQRIIADMPSESKALMRDYKPFGTLSSGAGPSTSYREM